MRSLVFLAAFQLLFAAASPGEVLEIRTLKTSRQIATAIKTNLDGGNLSNDRFEATYAKLAAERKIEELSRFIKTDATNNPIQFDATAVGNRWKTSAEIHPTFAETFGQASFSVTLTPPGGGLPDESPDLTYTGSASMNYDRWYVIFEMNHGSESVIHLAKIARPGQTPAHGNPVNLVMESYLVPMKEMEAANTGRLAADKIQSLAEQAVSNDESDLFRHCGSSGQKSRSAKVIAKNTTYPNAGRNPVSVDVETEATASPDGRWVYLNVQATVGSYLSTNVQPAYAAVFGETVRMEKWIAIPAERHPSGNSAVLFIKVSNLGGNPMPMATGGLGKPLPESGTATRTYPDIHPRIIRALSPPGTFRPFKDQLVANGIQDGPWSVVFSSNGVIVGNADVSVHRQIEALLAEYTWTKEIAKKTGAGQ